MTKAKHNTADLKFLLVEDVGSDVNVEKEAEHQAHACRWQTDDRRR